MAVLGDDPMKNINIPVRRAAATSDLGMLSIIFHSSDGDVSCSYASDRALIVVDAPKGRYVICAEDLFGALS